jgi:hypothetical protein
MTLTGALWSIVLAAVAVVLVAFGWFPCPGCCASPPQPCCEPDYRPTVLCVKVSHPGNPFDGVTFPIFHTTDPGCATSNVPDQWVARGTPPAGVGAVEWYHDAGSSFAICDGLFTLWCENNPGAGFHAFQIVTQSTDYCTYVDASTESQGINVKTLACRPFWNVTFAAKPFSVSGSTHPCNFGTSQAVTFTVTSDMSQCPGYANVAHIRACPAGIPIELYATFVGGTTGNCNTLTIPLTYRDCGGGGGAGGYGCVIYSGTAPDVNNAANTWTANVRSSKTLGMQFDCSLRTAGGQIVCSMSAAAALTVNSCGPAVQMTSAGFSFIGAGCLCTGTFQAVVHS